MNPLGLLAREGRLLPRGIIQSARRRSGEYHFEPLSLPLALHLRHPSLGRRQFGAGASPFRLISRAARSSSASLPLSVYPSRRRDLPHTASHGERDQSSSAASRGSSSSSTTSPAMRARPAALVLLLGVLLPACFATAGVCRFILFFFFSSNIYSCVRVHVYLRHVNVCTRARVAGCDT